MPNMLPTLADLLNNMCKYYGYYYDTSIRREDRKYLSTPRIIISYVYNITQICLISRPSYLPVSTIEMVK